MHPQALRLLPSYLRRLWRSWGTRVPALKVLEPHLLADLPVPSPVTLGLEHLPRVALSSRGDPLCGQPGARGSRGAARERV